MLHTRLRSSRSLLLLGSLALLGTSACVFDPARVPSYDGEEASSGEASSGERDGTETSSAASTTSGASESEGDASSGTPELDSGTSDDGTDATGEPEDPCAGARQTFASDPGWATVGLPVLTSDLGPVHVCHVGRGRSRRDRRLHVHSSVTASGVTVRGGVLMVSSALAIVQTASCSGLRAGLIAADAALSRGMVTAAELTSALASAGLAGEPSRAVAMADGSSESPGESWARLVFAGLALPVPELQAEIRDGGSTLVGRVDFLFRRQRLIVEFDGRVKYAGAEGRDALFREKRREDSLRALGYQVVRLTWSELHDPVRVRRLVSEAFPRR